MLFVLLRKTRPHTEKNPCYFFEILATEPKEWSIKNFQMWLQYTKFIQVIFFPNKNIADEALKEPHYAKNASLKQM